MALTKPPRPGKLPLNLDAHLAHQETEALAKLADAKAHLATVHAKQKARAQALRAEEETRLGKLAYAAGLAGVNAGVLEKEFALVVSRVTPPTEGNDAA